MNYSSIEPFLAPFNEWRQLKSVSLAYYSGFYIEKSWHGFS